MFTSKKSVAIHEAKSNLKQMKIPVDGQLSKKGTVIKNTDCERELDYSIADMVIQINQAGFQSMFSCSGLKKDHPLKDVKYDGAYIGFLFRDNDGKVLELIQKAAELLHMTAENSIINRQPALVVRIDRDKTGCSLSDRIKAANEDARMICAGSFLSYGACTRDLEAVLARNGGLIYDSDEKLESAWNAFRSLLLNSNCQYAS